MIYVFEDDERDPISQLFRMAYDNSVSSKFIYVRGGGNIYSKVESLLNYKDIILVYLNTIPGNKETLKIYNKLSMLSRKNNRSIIVLPILGAEYYFIKSIPLDKNDRKIKTAGVQITKLF